MERDFVTTEQIELARTVDVLDYLQRYEPDNLVRSAPDEYRLKDHDSLKISNGKFNRFSRGKGYGGLHALDFLVKVRGVEFKDAVRKLIDDFSLSPHDSAARQGGRPPPPARKSPEPPKQPKRQEAKRVLVLPPSANHNNDVIEYLKGRGIEEQIIKGCIEKRLLYQSTGQSCVFVGYDGEAVPKFACERGIKSDFKKDIAGSTKAHSFCMPPIAGGSHQHGNQNPQSVSNRLYVLEAPIECMSHATIALIGGTDWDGYRLSLGGISSMALNTFLENNPQITELYLCLNCDKAGIEATERIVNELIANEKHSHISIYIAPPPESTGKDYNDTLLYMRENMREKALRTDIDVAAAVEKPAAIQKPDTVKKRNDMAL